MRALGYGALVLLFVGAWIVWQIVRRASAGAQAIISPERYAIHKVEQMQRHMLATEPSLESDLTLQKSGRVDKWEALVKCDPEISAAAEQLRPYGDQWIAKLGNAYFALEEDRNYLPNIVKKLLGEACDAERQVFERRIHDFKLNAIREPLTEASLDILRRATEQGYVLTVTEGTKIAVSKGEGTSYLYSNSDIEWFGRYL